MEEIPLNVVDPATTTVLAAAGRVFSSKLYSAVDGIKNASIAELVQSCPNVSEVLGVFPHSIALVVEHSKRYKKRAANDHPLARLARSLKRADPVTYGELCEVVLRDDPRLNSVPGEDGSKSVFCEVSLASSLAEALEAKTVLSEDQSHPTVAW
ncbi:unnamed protein product [Calypogeia fissa]